MNWTELLNSEIETSYKTTQGLLDLVDPDQLDWKPGVPERRQGHGRHGSTQR